MVAGWLSALSASLYWTHVDHVLLTTLSHLLLLLLLLVNAGPEERRGRKGLFDLMQNKPLTPDSKRTAGDIWLEQRGKRFYPDAL